MSRDVRRLSPLESFQLMSLLSAEYTTSGLTDSAFAVFASARLAISGINTDHVKARRNELNIESHREMLRKPETVLERIAQLEEVVLAMSVRLQALES